MHVPCCSDKAIAVVYVESAIEIGSARWVLESGAVVYAGSIICLRGSRVNEKSPFSFAKHRMPRVSFNPGFFYRLTTDAKVDPAEVSKNGG